MWHSANAKATRQLGIPTANLPVDANVTPWIDSIESGVYFGYASLALPPTHPDHQHHDATASASAEKDENENDEERSGVRAQSWAREGI